MRRDLPADGRPGRAVLYVHGFVDYFFQRHVGEAFAAHGTAFYAVDLRGYGRSLRPGRPVNRVPALEAHAADLTAAVRAVRAEHDEVVLLGHSMGGLVAALWADGHPGGVDALVLNSPWLDLRGSWLERVPLTRVVDLVGRVAPGLRVGRLAEHYGRALHVSTGGEWDYDLGWKPSEPFPVRAGWLRSVRRGHARVARGLRIACPVLVATSDATGPDDRPHDALLTSDSVLDVHQIAARAPRLGPDVTLVTVPGGAHDLALSPGPARERYLAEVLGWIDDRLGAP